VDRVLFEKEIEPGTFNFQAPPLQPRSVERRQQTNRTNRGQTTFYSP